MCLYLKQAGIDEEIRKTFVFGSVSKNFRLWEIVNLSNDKCAFHIHSRGVNIVIAFVCYDLSSNVSKITESKLNKNGFKNQYGTFAALNV